MASDTHVRPVTGAGGRDDWDPASNEARENPFAVHARLRKECPVAHSTRWGGFWALTRYADIVSASRDFETFTATRQTVIPTSPRKGLPRLPLQADPPEHGLYRRALNPWFKDNRVQSLEPRLRGLVATLLNGCLHNGPVDIVNGLTEPFAVRSLCVLVGLDESEAAELARLSSRYIEAVQGQDLPTAGTLSRAVDGFAIELVADRKKRPRDPNDDMVSGLLAATAAGRYFTAEEVAGMVRLLLIGGHTVPKNFLGSMLWHLAQGGALQQTLRADPAKRPAAIEELLRLYSPNQALVRTTTRDATIGGASIPAGEPVALLFLSANRDEAVFDDPDVFSMERKPNRHIAFGFGPHACIAQALARLQTRLVLDAMLERTAGFDLAGAVAMAAWTEFGVQRMTLDVRLAEGDLR